MMIDTTNSKKEKSKESKKRQQSESRTSTVSSSLSSPFKRQVSRIRLLVITGFIFFAIDCCYVLYTIEQQQLADDVHKLIPVTTLHLNHTIQSRRRIRPNEVNNINNNKNIDIKSTSPAKQSADKTNTNNDDNSNDKGPILRLLQEAGFSKESLNKELINALPTWSEVVSLYGKEPIIIGLETCQEFQNSNLFDPSERLMGTAGTFNTGTNLMAQLLIENCFMPARRAKYGIDSSGMRWQVPWGKHTPIDNEGYRQSHKTGDDDPPLEADQFFPVVTVRDPAVWMASMCRHPYAMDWVYDYNENEKHSKHCPNLIPNEIDIAIDSSLQNTSSIPVSIQYKEFKRTHTSMIHHWNEYYNQYYKQPAKKFPRLIVRFEDIIFHPKNITTTACECAGGQIKTDKPFTYIVDSAKEGTAGHGTDKTGYVDAIIKYGTNKNRWKGTMTSNDLEYVQRNIDRDLMTIFQYKYPDTTLATQ